MFCVLARVCLYFANRIPERGLIIVLLSNLLAQHQEDLREVVYSLNGELSYQAALRAQLLLVSIDEVSEYLAEEGLEDTPIEGVEREC